MTTYREELFSDIYDELLPLIIEHALEVQGIVPDCDLNTYKQLELQERLVVLTARSSTLELIGYISVIISPKDLHYSYRSRADCDAVFVPKKHRSSGVGIRLLLGMENLLKDRGITIYSIGAKIGINSLEATLVKLGYKAEQVTMTKEI